MKRLLKNRLIGKKRIYLNIFNEGILSWVNECYVVEAEKEARSIGLKTGEEYLSPKQVDDIANGIYKYIQCEFFIK